MPHIDDLTTRQNNLSYIRHAMKTPMLSKEDEFKLAMDWKDNKNEKSLHKLIQPYMRLSISIATRFKNYGLPVGDLIQEGNIGLMEAAQRFEPELGNRFSTYSSWWIRAAIQDYVLRNWSIVRIGTTAAQKSLFFNLRRLRAKIEGQSSKDYLSQKNVENIADELNVKTSDVTKMEARLSGSDSSLNTPIGDDNQNERQDLLEDNVPNPEDIVTSMKDAQTRSIWLSDAIDKLSEREKNIITKRQLSDDVVTLDKLGQELGISKERVRQLEKGAIQKLRISVGKTLISEKLDITQLLTL